MVQTLEQRDQHLWDKFSELLNFFSSFQRSQTRQGWIFGKMTCMKTWWSASIILSIPPWTFSSLWGQCFQRGWWEFLTARLLPPAWLSRAYQSVTTFESLCGSWRAGGWGRGGGPGVRRSPGRGQGSSPGAWSLLLILILSLKTPLSTRSSVRKPGFLLVISGRFSCVQTLTFTVVCLFLFLWGNSLMLEAKCFSEFSLENFPLQTTDLLQLNKPGRGHQCKDRYLLMCSDLVSSCEQSWF